MILTDIVAKGYRFSPREIRLINLVLDGYTSTEMISEVTKLHPRTVKLCFNRIFLKMGINTEEYIGKVRMIYLLCRQQGVSF